VMLSTVWKGSRSAFRYPLEAVPATAVLVPWFRQTRGPVRIVDNLPPNTASHASIAATWPQFERLIGAGHAAPTHSAIVLRRPEDAFLTQPQRDLLWQAFGVPVFEQIIGDCGELLAAECEAHEGLHLESASFRPAGLPLETAPCGCGRKTPRLIPVRAPAAAAAAR